MFDPFAFGHPGEDSFSFVAVEGIQRIFKSVHKEVQIAVIVLIGPGAAHGGERIRGEGPLGDAG